MNEYLDAKLALMSLSEERCVSFHESCYTEVWVAKYRKRHQRDMLSKQKQPDVLQHVDVEGESARAVTCEDSKRHVYHLQRINFSWRIGRTGCECYSCRGTGVYEGGECSSCSGDGWCYSDTVGHSITDHEAEPEDDEDTNNPHRFSIRELMISDAKGHAVTEIDILEFADMSSDQFQRSKLGVSQKIDIIHSVDEERLVEAIDRLCLWKIEASYTAGEEVFFGALDACRGEFYKTFTATCEHLSILGESPNDHHELQLVKSHQDSVDEEFVAEFMRQYFEWCHRLVRLNDKSRDGSLVQYFTEDCWKTERSANAQNHQNIVLDVDIDDEAAVFTSELIGNIPTRRIYHLRKADVGWQIERRGIECFSCKGAGSAYGKVCSKCHGLQWKYFGASDR